MVLDDIIKKERFNCQGLFEKTGECYYKSYSISCPFLYDGKCMNERNIVQVVIKYENITK